MADEPARQPNLSETAPTGAAGAFTLESEGPRIRGNRVFYPKSLAEYAQTIGRGERTLKRWIEAGKAADPVDLPPLHRPPDLIAWLRKHRKNDIDDELLHRLGSPVAPTVASATTPPDPEAEAEGEEQPAPHDLSNLQIHDLEGNVMELRRSVAIAHRLLDQALRAQRPNEAQITTRQRAYKESFNLLRLAEADLLEYQKARGELVLKADVRKENNSIITVIVAAVHRLVKNVRPQLVDKKPAEQDAIWKDETSKCFRVLRDAKFTDAAAAGVS